MSALLDAVWYKQWTPEQIRDYLGQHRSVYFTYAADPKFRRGAGSGGSTTALLASMLTTAQIDGALVLTTRIVEGHVRPKFVIATTVPELLSAQGSKYSAVYFTNDALPLIRAFDGRLAVVALPCDARILQSAREKDPALDARIKCVITLFCGHNSEPELTDLVVSRLKPEGDELTGYTFRTGRVRGELTAEFRQAGAVSRPFSFMSDYRNVYFFAQKKCHHCFDHFGYFCDISAGDIWTPQMMREPVKHTALVSRSEAGDGLIRAALESGTLIGETRSAEEVLNGQARTAPFHYNITARARAGRLLGETIKDRTLSHVHWNDYLVGFLAIFNEKLTRSAFGRKLVGALPRPLLKAYLIFLKGLESLPLPSQADIATARRMNAAQAAAEAARFPGKSVGIIGATLTGNRGAESMLVTTIGQVRERFPGTRIYIFSYLPGKDRALINDPWVSILDARPQSLVIKHFPFAFMAGLLRLIGVRAPNALLTKEVKRLRECAALLDVSGISFADGREKFLPFNILNMWPALLLGVPVIRLAQAVGPFKNPLNRLIAKLFLLKSAKIHARGDTTGQHLVELGAPPAKWSRAADIAFLYQPEYSLSDENEDKVEAIMARLDGVRTSGKRLIVLSPSSVVQEKSQKGGQDYLGRFLQLIRELPADHYHFLVLPNATRQGKETHRNNDLHTMRLLRKRAEAELPAGALDAVDWVNFDVNTASIRQFIARADVLVTSRFHAMISGLVLAIPMAVIGWSHKYNEVLADFEVEDFARDFADPDLDICVEVEKLFMNRDAYREKLTRALPAVQALAARQFEELGEWLNLPARH